MRTLRILSAAALAYGFIAATAIAFSERERQHAEEARKYFEAEKERMAEDERKACKSVMDAFLEAQQSVERDEYGVTITPNTIALESPEASREIGLSTDGALRFCEDGKTLSTKMMSGWPKGNYKIHYYRTFNRDNSDRKAGDFIYLFFENLGSDGVSRFCKASFKKRGFYSMDYVMVLNGSLEQISLSATGKEEAENKPFVLDSEKKAFGACCGRQANLYVSDKVYVGDTMGTVRNFVFINQDDSKVYLCEVENARVLFQLAPEEGWASFDIIGMTLIADCGEYYVAYYLSGSAPLGRRFFKDKFGAHDYARFKAACLRGQTSENLVNKAFYEEIPDPTVEKK